MWLTFNIVLITARILEDGERGTGLFLTIIFKYSWSPSSKSTLFRRTVCLFYFCFLKDGEWFTLFGDKVFFRSWLHPVAQPSIFFSFFKYSELGLRVNKKIF